MFKITREERPNEEGQIVYIVYLNEQGVGVFPTRSYAELFEAALEKHLLRGEAV
jgi:hypothetical protein